MFHRTYRTKEAVKAIDLTIAPGERVGYIGFNGAGKSTTIKMLAGVLRPDAGNVRVFGLDPHADRVKNASQIGAVFGQRTQLFWDIPVQESFELLKEIYQVPTSRVCRDARVVSGEARSRTTFRRTSPTTVAWTKDACELAAAFLHRPKVVYLDEPTIGLDIEIKETIRHFIREMSDRWGTTVILTTHDMQDIEEVCDRVIVLDDGKIIYDDTIDQLKASFSHERTLRITL